jgi:hypothetical protein
MKKERKELMGDFWWDTHHDDGCINEILKLSVEARRWYLLVDVKVRLTRFILHHAGFDEVIQLWKRLQIVKKDLGEEAGTKIIQKALQEVEAKFSEPEWKESINEKITQLRKMLNDDFVTMI